MKRAFVVAVDVGTGSARAGIFDMRGTQLGRADYPIVMNRPAPNHAEHDSEDIWMAVCQAVRTAIEKSGVEADDIHAIGFDATCSIVVRSSDGEQVTVSRGGEDRWDTIVWLDHRAIAEADEATATGHRVVDYAGGAMSAEMATPKLAWLKRNLPESWARAGLIFDLADFLTWKATGSTARSQCTLTCKWGYLAHEAEGASGGWPDDYYDTLDLGDMRLRAGLPARPVPVGSNIGSLTATAAAELGLTKSCRVAAGLIDAHAGVIGLLSSEAREPDKLRNHAALIAGTSSCVATMGTEPLGRRGVWGPYLGVAMPDLWLSEAGQSATGALLDHVILIQGGGGFEKGMRPDPGIHGEICGRIQQLRLAEGANFGARLHVLPDFHGNRAPLADPHALGVISGLSLDASFDALCRLYYRTAVAIALGLRQILETFEENGLPIEHLHIAGGHARNPLLLELYAAVTGRTLLESGGGDAVLLGTAMAAAVAAGLHPDLIAAGESMHKRQVARRPNAALAREFDRDYRIFLEMQRQRKVLDAMQHG